MEQKLNDVRLILGSETDAKNANYLLVVFKAVGVRCGVSVASCHRDAGPDFEAFLASVKESIIVYLGGMEFAAPGIAESINRNAGRIDKLIFAVPTDKAARSAIENLPMGTGVATSGLNEISLKHSLANSALFIAKLAGMLGNNDILAGLKKWHAVFREKKPLVAEIQLKDGLIPIVAQE